MKTFRKVFRILMLTFIIALAASGAGMLGALNMRERYIDKAITIEQVDKKRSEKEDEEDEIKG